LILNTEGFMEKYKKSFSLLILLKVKQLEQLSSLTIT
jgi:hypothetical protein